MNVKKPPVSAGLIGRIPLFVWVLLCATLWGSAFPVIKLVFEHWEHGGHTIGFEMRSLFAGVRFAAAGLVLLVLSRQPGKELRATPWHWIAAMALTQTLGQYVFFYLGLQFANGALASLLTASGSFWWVILAPLLLRTRSTSALQWAVLLVGAAGVSLAVYAPGAGGVAPRLGAIFVLIASLFGALGMIVFQQVRLTMGARAGTGFSLLFGGLLFLLLGLREWAAFSVLFDGYVLLRTAWLAFVSAAAFALWNHLSTLYPVQVLATYRFLIPVMGVIESLILLEGERLSWGLIAGGLLVVLAMVLAPRVQPPQRAGLPIESK